MAAGTPRVLTNPLLHTTLKQGCFFTKHHVHTGHDDMTILV